ncbi:biotin transporter BioY [Candidatus Babeliales bacterium]|nr:biotin transporter BioY [Candidatus Babeliales bacterium]MCF7899567.1 biotin transporter BioY [Candidatus Babeliales bacterium]
MDKLIFFKKFFLITKLVRILFLSWFFALCSQIIIPLPFNFVPISLQPAPIFFFALYLGWPSVAAIALTIIQAAFGAPFFSGFQGGILKLLGPTGGYIFGFLLASCFLALARKYKKKSFFINFFKLLIANLILYCCGLFQLYFFVPGEKLLILGLYPFIAGCLLKIFFICLLVDKVFKNS